MENLLKIIEKEMELQDYANWKQLKRLIEQEQKVIKKQQEQINRLSKKVREYQFLDMVTEVEPV